MEKRDLVQRAREGDAAAFAGLYKEIYKDLYKFALYTLGNVQDAEDAVSDAVLDGFAGIGGLRNEEAFRGWMFRILSAKCKQRLKGYLTKTEELPEDLPKEENDWSERLDVRRAFFRLSGEERLVVSLHLFAGYRTWEIARFLNMNDSTVRSKEYRALRKLEKLLSEKPL